jgi:hypothetical protein
MTFKVCCHSKRSSTHGGIICYSYSLGDYADLNAALDRIISVVANSSRPFENETTIYYINVIAPEGVYPLVSHTYSYEDCVKLVAQRRETRRLVAEICVINGMPAGTPCWIAQEISITSGN